jgi:UDP-glucuronate 4-epimerase
MATLVTGAAGFIGSHVTDALLEQGTPVVGLDNFDPFYARESKESNLRTARAFEAFELVEGDIRDGSTLDRLPGHIDTIVHLAALAGVRPSIADPVRYTEVNLLGTARLLQFAKLRGIRSFVFASSSSVYGNNEKVPFREDDPVVHPISPYAATKRSGELLCRAGAHLDGIGIICLRLFTVYGPRQRPDLAIHKFARRLEEGASIPMFGDGSTSRDYTFISDIVEGVCSARAWAGRHPGEFEIVNLGESETVTLRRMIDTLGRAMGVEPQISRLPLQPGDVARTHADIGKARRLLGYDPQVGFEDGIDRFVHWMRTPGYMV